MSEVTRKSVLALIEESSRGVPISPSTSNDYTALQTDATITPSFDELENEELSSSIGKKQTVLGIERPEMSFSHYLRHSGVEGQAPDYKLLLKALLGSETVNATEYDTIAGATTGDATTRAIVKVDSGEGALFERGQGLLIKDANGYNVRNVYSISSDDLSLAFNLASAPSSGVNLGKAILYKPEQTDANYPSLAAWMYRGNGGAIELVSGSRVTEMAIDVTAGEYINGSFSLAGLNYSFNPIEIDSSNNHFDFDIGGAELNAEIPEGTYKDPNELAAAIEVALNALSSDTITCNYSSITGKFTVASDGVTLNLLFNTGSNTANGIHTTLGFSSAADSTGATTYTAATAQVWSSPYTPSYDSENPVVAKNIQVQWGHFNEYVCKNASSVSVTISNDVADVNSICSESGRSDTVFSSRTVEIETTLLLTKNEVDTFTRFRKGTSVPFALNFGRKSGGSWVAGSVANIYVPDTTITSFELTDEDGLVALNISFRAYVASGQTDEVYINFL